MAERRQFYGRQSQHTTLDWNDEFWRGPHRRPPVRSSTVTSVEESENLRSNEYPRHYLSGPSHFLKRQLSRQLSTTSSSTGASVSSSLSNSQTGESSFADSRISSWSSLFLDGTENSDSSSTNFTFNPLVEKGIDLMSSEDGNYFMEPIPRGQRFSKGNQTFDDEGSSRPKELIIPDEEEEYPFARYTFNKKPDKDTLSSHSDKSSSSKESGFDMSRNQRKKISSSSKSNVTSSLSSMSEVPSNWSIDTAGSNFQSQNSLPAAPVPTSYQPLPVGPQTWQYPPEPLMQAPKPGFMSPISPNPMMMGHFAQTVPMEQVLMNLGFAGAGDSFLPERFVRDWYTKLLKHQEMIRQQQLEMMYSDSEADISSMHSSGYNTPLWKCPSDINIRSSLSMNNKHKFYSNANSQNVSFDLGQGSALDRQASIEKLRELLHIQAKKEEKTFPLPVNKDFRRKCFASARQKSLPAYLETLDEEDEGKKSKQLKNKVSKLGSDTSSVDSTQPSTQNSNEDLSLEIGTGTDTSHEPSTDNSTTSGSRYDSPRFWNSGDINDDILPKGTTKKEKETENGINSHNIPSIVIKSHSQTPSPSQSSNHLASADSLEVADIFMKIADGKPELNVEPAMISFNLHDYEDTAHNKSHLNLPLNTSHDTSSGSSPAPLSPVTVIEVGLDNQNDSLDADDGVHVHNISREGDLENDGLLKKSLRRSTILSWRKSPVPEMPNVSKEKDRHKKRVSIELPKFEKDACIQADDGSLSPIIRFSDYDYIIRLLSKLEDSGFYLAHNQATQWEDPKGKGQIDYERDFCNGDGLLTTDDKDEPAATSSRKHSMAENLRLNVKDSQCQTASADYMEEKAIQTEVFSVQFRNFMTSTSEESGTESETGVFIDKENTPPMRHLSQNSRYSPLEVTLERLERKTRKWRSKHATDKK